MISSNRVRDIARAIGEAIVIAFWMGLVVLALTVFLAIYLGVLG